MEYIDGKTLYDWIRANRDETTSNIPLEATK